MSKSPLSPLFHLADDEQATLTSSSWMKASVGTEVQFVKDASLKSKLMLPGELQNFLARSQHSRTEHLSSFTNPNVTFTLQRTFLAKRAAPAVVACVNVSSGKDPSGHMQVKLSSALRCAFCACFERKAVRKALESPGGSGPLRFLQGASIRPARHSQPFPVISRWLPS